MARPTRQRLGYHPVAVGGHFEGKGTQPSSGSPPRGYALGLCRSAPTALAIDGGRLLDARLVVGPADVYNCQDSMIESVRFLGRCTWRVRGH